ncbi:MAG: hypothetical protein ABI537_09375, partial [Casimicrobiaceae bacterium]
CTAARQPNMRFVAMKSVALGQQAPQPIDQCRALFDQPLPQPMHTQRRLGESDNRSDRRLQTQTNLPAAARADERMWDKRAVSSMAHASMTAHRSDIELQSVLRYC